jgi:HD domain-containing protein
MHEWKLPERIASDQAAVNAVRRLSLITGFATVYGVRLDRRLAVFARIRHVQRVVAFAILLARRFSVPDVARVQVLGWLHDLNRWPFAHNSEAGLFDQPLNSLDFLREFSGVQESDVDEIVSIQRKDLSELSPEALCVLLADAVVGMLEDPLLLITALRVRPELLPKVLSAKIGFSHCEDPWRKKSYEIARLVTPGCSSEDMNLARNKFDSLLMDQARLVLDCRVGNSVRILERAGFLLNLAQEVKSACHRPIIFPINNDLVSHAPWLQQRVMPWYCAGRSTGDLVILDEYEFVDRVVSMPGSPFVRDEFIPDIDVVVRENPDLRFVED